MKPLKLFFLMCFAFGVSTESIAQTNVVDYTFTFLDKNGLRVGYEVQLIVDSTQIINEKQRQELLNQTKKVVLGYGRNLPAMDFLSKRDSIENRFVRDVKIQAKMMDVNVDEIRIMNLLLPKPVFDAILKRQELTAEPLTLRVKPLD